MTSLLTRRPALRWMAPVAALVTAVGGVQLASHVSADADSDLPPRTAQQLLTDLQTAEPRPFSGTIRTKAALGLPEIPAQGSQPALDLLTGSRTLKVWYADPQHSRVSLLGDGQEAGVYVDPQHVWTWNSRDRSVTRLDVPKAAGDKVLAGPDGSGITELGTPSGLSQQVLKMLDPSTEVTSSGDVSVAGRAAYELRLTPRTTATRVGSVRIAVDAATKLPLRGQVFARGSSSPALEVGFTDLDLSRPDAAAMRFTPPPGATVETYPKKGVNPSQPDLPEGDGPEGRMPKPSDLDDLGLTPPRVTGEGWASVVSGRSPMALPVSSHSSDSAGDESPLAVLPRVSGAWGQGYLLDTRLFSAVVSDDGRFALGAVDPSRLYPALPAR